MAFQLGAFDRGRAIDLDSCKAYAMLGKWKRYVTLSVRTLLSGDEVIPILQQSVYTVDVSHKSVMETWIFSMF